MSNETQIEGSENPQIDASNEKNSSSKPDYLNETQPETFKISEKTENIPQAPLISQPPKKQLSEKQLKALEKGRKKLERLRKRNSRKRNKMVNKKEKENKAIKTNENDENKENKDMVEKKNENKEYKEDQSSLEDITFKDDKENKIIVIERKNDGYILLFLIGIIAVILFFLFRYLRNRSQNNNYETYMQENEEVNIRDSGEAPVTSDGAYPVFEQHSG